jgi:predicted transcriptional regulator
MNRLVDQGVLGFRDGTGKGGHHKIYYPLMDEKGYVKYLMKTMVESMIRDFPEETKEVLSVYVPG